MDLVRTVTFFDGIQEVTQKAYRCGSGVHEYYLIYADYGYEDFVPVYHLQKRALTFEEMTAAMDLVEQ